MTPEFSIIVPVYKVEEYLRLCVDSVLGQSFPDFELLLVDDGSPDGCGAICDEYGQKDGRVRVIHQKNSGVNQARKAALELAAGKYLCFVDSDDMVMEGWLETIHCQLAANDWPDMLLFDYVEDNGQTSQPLFAAPGYYDKARMEQEIYPHMIADLRRSFLTQLIPGYLWTKVVRRELFASHYIQDFSITVYEDVAMIYECLYNAGSLAVCPDRLYLYRRRETSALLHYDADDIPNMKRCRDYMVEHICRQYPPALQQVDAFFISKLLRSLYQESKYGYSVRQAGEHIAAGLDSTGLARDMSAKGIPLRNRLFFSLLRRRRYRLAVLVYRVRVWLFRRWQAIRTRR